MLAQVLHADVRQLVFGIDVVYGDYLLHHKLLDKEVPQSHMFDSRAEGSITGDVQGRSVVDVH